MVSKYIREHSVGMIRASSSTDRSIDSRNRSIILVTSAVVLLDAFCPILFARSGNAVMMMGGDFPQAGSIHIQSWSTMVRTGLRPRVLKSS